jgi:hypothetical protein
MDLPTVWKLIEADLERAASLLPAAAANDRAIVDFRDYLSHNELELACDMLEHYAEDHSVPGDFWLALRDAARRMELPKRAARYAAFGESTQ